MGKTLIKSFFFFLLFIPALYLIEKFERHNRGEVPSGIIYQTEYITVIDGDTYKLADGEKIRLIGVDCPELHKQKKWYVRFLLNLSGGKEVNTTCLAYYGKVAKDFVEHLYNIYSIVLFLIIKKDKYGRYLAYAYLPLDESSKESKDVGEELIKNGLAIVYPFEDFGMKSYYYNLTIEAMKEGKGLWKCVS